MKYVRGSETSRRAAEEIEMNADSLRGRTYRYLIGRGNRGATDEEIQTASGMNPSTQRPRRVELVERGLVKDSGQTRLTKSSRSAVVWISVQHGESNEQLAFSGITPHSGSPLETKQPE